MYPAMTSSSKRVVVVAIILLLLAHSAASTQWFGCGTGKLVNDLKYCDAKNVLSQSVEWVLKHHPLAYLYYCLPGGKEKSS